MEPLVKGGGERERERERERESVCVVYMQDNEESFTHERDTMNM